MKRSLTKVSHQKELVEYHFRSGKKKLANEEYEEAIKHFSLLHKLVPTENIYTENLAESHYLRAQDIELEDATDFQLALTHFQKAFELMPTNYIYTYSLATALLELGQDFATDHHGEKENALAITYLNQAHKLVPFAGQTEYAYNKILAEAHSYCGITLLELGAGDLSRLSLWKEMFVHLKTAYTLFPAHAAYTSTLAEGQYDFAREIRNDNLMSYTLEDLSVLKIKEDLLPYYPKDDKENEGLTPFLFETIGNILSGGYTRCIMEVNELAIFPPVLMPLIEAYADFETPLELAGAATEPAA